MNETSHLVQMVARLKDTPVLCVGDVMLDRFVYGSVDRISPEAPIPVLCIEREAAMLGGAGNVVRNVVAVGAAPAFVSVVGDDAAGHEVARLLGEHCGIDPCIVVDAGRQTTIKTRFFASAQQLLRADQETTSRLSDAVGGKLLARAGELLPTVKAAAISDYGKGVLAMPIVAELIQRARARGLPVVVDPKGEDYAIYRGATVLTPNRKELRLATKMPVDDDAGIIAAARHLIATCGMEAVLVTRSQDGMTLVTAAGAVDHLPAEAREVYDVSGAGDTALAGLVLALTSGSGLEEAAHFANAAAGVVVAKLGTATVSPAELLDHVSHAP